MILATSNASRARGARDGGDVRPRGAFAPPALIILLATWVAWAALYVWRTSFVVDGHRVFSLWDDGMISMHFARNLVEGHGLVWNPGERVQGFSNLAVTLAMTAIHLTPVEPIHAAVVFQLAMIAVGLAVLVQTWRLCLATFGGDERVALAAVAAVACLGPLHIWTLQGSDVGLVTLLALTALLEAQRGGRQPRQRLWLLLGAGVTLRLDCALLLVPFVGLIAEAPRGRLREAGRALWPMCLGLLAVLGFGLAYYGDPLPNTYYLKSTGSPRDLVLFTGYAQLFELCDELAVSLSIAAAATVAMMRAEPGVRRMALLVVMLCGYGVWVGGDWRPQYVSRFIAPALPVCALLCVAGAVRAADALRAALDRRARGPRPATARRGAVMIIATAGAGAGLSLSTPLAAREWLQPGEETMLRSYNQRNAEIGLWLHRWSAPQTVLALHWAGIPAYLSQRPAVDVLGKCDRHIAHLRVDRFIPAHSKWDWDYVLARQPDVFLLADRGLEVHPRFCAEYERLQLEEHGSLFVRKASRALLGSSSLPTSPACAAVVAAWSTDASALAAR